MLEKLLTALTLAAFIVPSAFAQTGNIIGTVTDAESEETIPGANVTLPEINRGAATNPDGAYSISNVPVGTYTLRVTFVGYRAFETEVTIQENQTTTQDAALEPGAVGLEEVVVTGYGTQRRAEVSGAISSVSSEEIEGVPVQSTESLLQGRTAGVTVSTTSGNPGGGFEVDIRGEGSINAGNRPLYIVDGVQMSFSQGAALTDRTPMNAISPEDIESIEVLKDAAAASIYGAQASNGVVLITTKSGREGATQVSVNYEAGTRFSGKRFDVMNRDQWIDFHIDAWGEENTRAIISNVYGYDEDTPFSEMRDYDWQDFVFRNGTVQSASFTATGGDANTQFYLSGGWESTEAAVRSVSYESFNFRTNLTQQFTPNLNVDVRLALSNQDQPTVCQDGFFVNCPFYQMVEEGPVSFPFLENGDYNPNTEQGLSNNPAVVLLEEQRSSNATQLLGSIAPTYNFTSWLSLQGRFGLDWQRLEETDHEPPIADPGALPGSTRRRHNEVTNITANLTLNARGTFSDVHNISGLVGTEYRRDFEVEDDYVSAGFSTDLLSVVSAAAENTFFQGFNTEYRLLGYFGQVNYNYDQRYLLTLTTRYDGTSRFGQDRRFGFFPSGSVAWRLSEEEFFNADFVDDLKFRVGYGITGNSDIGNFSSRGLYSVSGSYDGQVGIRPSQLANRTLTWEESRELNLGMDWSLFEGRITGSLDLYRNISDNLLLSTPLPLSSGFGAITDNVGQVQNQGIELSLETINLRTESGFRWSTRFTAGLNQNTVKELTEGAEELFPGSTLPIAVGHSQEAWKVPYWAGVNPADGRPMWYDADGNITYNPDVADQQFADGGEEDVEGGFGTRLSYKGLALDAFFNFSYGGTALPFTQTTWSTPNFENSLAFWATERWREPGDVAQYPRAVPNGNFDNAESYQQVSTLWLYDSSYLRLRNISLSYTLPSRLTETIGLRRTQVYVTGLNLITWTSYLGIDPEVAGAFEESSYPAERQFNVGIRVDL